MAGFRDFINLNERLRKLSKEDKALLRKDINDMTDEEKARRKEIDAADWDENAEVLNDKYGKHKEVSPLEDEANFHGIGKDKKYQIKTGMNVFVYRNLNVTTIDPRFHDNQVVWSIRSNKNYKAGGGYDDIKAGNVIHHAENVALADARFEVKEGYESKHGKYSEIEWSDTGRAELVKTHPADGGFGWRGVRSSGQKNVHAGVVGDLLSWGKVAFPSFKEIMGGDEWQVMTYDPYKYTAFQIVDKTTLGPGKKMEVLGEASSAKIVLMGNMVADILGVMKTQRPLVLGRKVS
jgi:hypothetical protein